jgi:hypothetical protein
MYSTLISLDISAFILITHFNTLYVYSKMICDRMTKFAYYLLTYAVDTVNVCDVCR